MKSSLLKLVVAFLVPLCANNLQAQWSNDPTVNTPISTAINQQSAPQIISDGSGGAIITWVDDRNGTTNNNIYAQRIDANGTVHTGWTVDGVAICTTPYQQFGPTLLSDGAGGAIITWADNRNGTNDIYAQRINADGAIHPAWPTDGVPICTAANNQVTPQIISDDAGGAIITWRDDRTTSLDYDIYAQRIDADGAIHTGWTLDGVAICTAVNPQITPQLASDGSGGTIITWRDRRNGIDNDIYAQRIDADGTIHSTWTADGVPVCTATDNQAVPQIISDGAGGAIITWEDRRSGPSGTRFDIYAQRIDSSGTINTGWTQDGVPICTAGQIQNSAQIISDGYGGAIITWEDQRDGNSDVYAQRIEPNGIVLWTQDGVAISTETDNQSLPQIKSDGAGGAIVTWYDLRSGEYDIYAQKIDANGTAQWITDGIAVSTATNNQSYPQLISDGVGGAIITWEDIRNGTDNDVYASRIFADGSLASTPAAPQNLVVTDSSSGSITIMWTQNTEPDFLQYYIYRDTLPNPVVKIDSATGGLSDTSKTYTGLTNGTRYYFRVTAVDSTGFESGFSNEVSATPVPPLTVTLFNPTRNALNIAANTTIEVTFSHDIDTTTLADTTVRISGSLSGLHTCVFSYNSGTYTATIDPSLDFQVGELVNVMLTRRIKSTIGVALESAYYRSFTIKINTASSGTFKGTSTTGVGGGPLSVTAGDLDRDGDIDLASANYLSSTVSILINDGSGTFVQSSAPGVGNYPRSITAGDLDGDGDIDLATANQGANTVSILLNDSSGTFTQSSTLDVGNVPESVIAGDLDGDGDIDLAVANEGSNTVSILLNDGNGTFTQSSTPGVGSQPYSVTAGDLDGDGDIDLATANQNAKTVSILLNDGSGTFTQNSTPAVGTHAYCIISGDLDGDGDIDLVTVNQGDNTVSILLNDGSGTFTQSSTPGVGSYPESATIGDLDGDGDLDLAVANEGSNAVSILMNNGNGTFIQSSMPSVGNQPYSVTGGDFDRDGDLDLAAANLGSNNISVLKNIPAPPTGLVVTDSSSKTITIRWQRNKELNLMHYRIYGDTLPNPVIKIDSTTGGISDTSKAITGLTNGTRYYFRVTAVDNTGNESDFSNEVDAVPVDLIAPAVPQNLVVTDSSSQTITINWQRNTEADFIRYRIYRDTIPNPTTKVDSTTGGITDTTKTFTGLTNGKRYYFRVTSVDSVGNESGYSNEVSATPGLPSIISFTPTRNALNVPKDTIITVTFNRDIDQSTINDSTININSSIGGLHTSAFIYDTLMRTVTINPITDFQVGELVSVTLTRGIKSAGGDSLTSAQSWSFTIKANIATGTFIQSSTPSVGNTPDAVTSGDLDGDGDIDLAVANWGSDTVSILLNNGSGIFTQSTTPAVGSYPFLIISGDFDGDGDIDLAIADDAVSILFNNGNGTFAPRSSVNVKGDPISVTTGDLDGDGDIDLASASPDSNTVSILLNNGNGTFAQSSTPSVGNSPYSVTAGDFDGDGDIDLATANLGSNTASILLNNGSGGFIQSPTTPTVGSWPCAVTSGDLDGDGDIDLAVANWGSDTVSILLNNGSGIFTQSSAPGVGEQPASVTSGDLDGDGDIDLAVANVNDNTVSILLNNGSGTFIESSTPNVVSPTSVTAGDFDGDGDIDLAVSNQGSNTVSILLNGGTTGVENTRITIPTQFDLAQNYPNPFNPATVIKYQLPAFSSVKLSVYDILGREVATLVDGVKEAGFYTATFDGSKVASGIYFTRLVALPQNGGQPFVQVKKMLMMK
jgi:fibronectin type 3 domain-containing protein